MSQDMQDSNELVISSSQFEMSRGWIYCFMKQKGMTQKINIAKPMNDFYNKITVFHRFITRKNQSLIVITNRQCVSNFFVFQ
jgi:hypothetical protein